MVSIILDNDVTTVMIYIIINHHVAVTEEFSRVSRQVTQMTAKTNECTNYENCAKVSKRTCTFDEWCLINLICNST